MFLGAAALTAQERDEACCSPRNECSRPCCRNPACRDLFCSILVCLHGLLLEGSCQSCSLVLDTLGPLFSDIGAYRLDNGPLAFALESRTVGTTLARPLAVTIQNACELSASSKRCVRVVMLAVIDMLTDIENVKPLTVGGM